MCLVSVGDSRELVSGFLRSDPSVITQMGSFALLFMSFKDMQCLKQNPTANSEMFSPSYIIH